MAGSGELVGQRGSGRDAGLASRPSPVSDGGGRTRGYKGRVGLYRGNGCEGRLRPSRSMLRGTASNDTLHPPSGVGLGADFVRIFARRG